MNPTPATNTAQIHGAQPPDCPSCRAKTIRNIAGPDNRTPMRSTRCLCVGNTGISQNASARPMMPIGTLTKKIHAQPSASTSTPPANGPTSVATPAVAPHTLIAIPRRSGGKMRVITDSVCGVSTPAPIPWTTLAAISMPMVPDRPHHSEAAGDKDCEANKIEFFRADPVTESARHQQRNRVSEQVGAGHPDHHVVAGAQLDHEAGVCDRD